MTVRTSLIVKLVVPRVDEKPQKMQVEELTVLPSCEEMFSEER